MWKQRYKEEKSWRQRTHQQNIIDRITLNCFMFLELCLDCSQSHPYPSYTPVLPTRPILCLTLPIPYPFFNHVLLLTPFRYPMLLSSLPYIPPSPLPFPTPFPPSLPMSCPFPTPFLLHPTYFLPPPSYLYPTSGIFTNKTLTNTLWCWIPLKIKIGNVIAIKEFKKGRIWNKEKHIIEELEDADKIILMLQRLIMLINCPQIEIKW